jgi:hypothetical protein
VVDDKCYDDLINDDDDVDVGWTYIPVAMLLLYVRCVIVSNIYQTVEKHNHLRPHSNKNESFVTLQQEVQLHPVDVDNSSTRSCNNEYFVKQCYDTIHMKFVQDHDLFVYLLMLLTSATALTSLSYLLLETELLPDTIDVFKRKHQVG